MVARILYWVFSSFVTKEVVAELIEEIFALLQAGVARTSTDLDDKALAALVANVDVDTLSEFVTAWLRNKLSGAI